MIYFQKSHNGFLLISSLIFLMVIFLSSSWLLHSLILYKKQTHILHQGNQLHAIEYSAVSYITTYWNTLPKLQKPFSKRQLGDLKTISELSQSSTNIQCEYAIYTNAIWLKVNFNKIQTNLQMNYVSTNATINTKEKIYF